MSLKQWADNGAPEKRAPAALSYNALVRVWPEIARLSRVAGKPRFEQTALFAENEE
jgi:hypothetical protein